MPIFFYKNRANVKGFVFSPHENELSSSCHPGQFFEFQGAFFSRKMIPFLSCLWFYRVFFQFYISKAHHLSQNLMSFFTFLQQALPKGIPLTQALQLFCYMDLPFYHLWVFQDIYHKVTNGIPLSEALGTHPKFFPKIASTILRISEKTNTLPKGLESITHFHNQEETFKKDLKKKMFYPLILCFFACITLGILFIFLIPQVESFLASSNMEPPAIFQIIKNASNAVTSPFTYFIILVLLSIYYRKKKKKKGFAYYPWGLNIKYYKEMYLLFLNLETLLHSKLSIKEGLGILVHGNDHSIKRVYEEVLMGVPFEKAFVKNYQVDPFTFQFLNISSITQNFEATVGLLREHYLKTLQSKLHTLIQLVEPFIMIIIGALFVTGIYGVLFPIYEQSFHMQGI